MKLANYKIYILILLLVPFIVLTIKNINKFNSDDSQELKKRNIFFENLKKNNEQQKIFGNSKIIFFIDFEDFSCLECESQVIYLCKWVESNIDRGEKKSTLLLVRKRNNNEQYYKWLITSWLKENEINLPIELVSDSLFNKLKIFKTSIAIFNERDERLIEYKEIPMPARQLEKIKKIIEKLW